MESRGNRRIYEVDSVSLWILRNCGIAGGFESLREEGLYFLQKQKVAKTFTRLVRVSANLPFLVN